MLNFLDFLANSEQSSIREIVEKRHIFKEIVLEINLERNLPFPEFIKAFSLDFDQLNIRFGDKPVVRLFIHEMIELATANKASFFQKENGLGSMELMEVVSNDDQSIQDEGSLFLVDEN